MTKILSLQDDVRLLRMQTCAAIAQPFAFLSLYRTSKLDDTDTTPACYNVWGTQACVIARGLKQQITNLDPRTSCRLEIDLYLQSIGPWPVTQHELVEHVGSRFMGHALRGLE